MKRPLFSAAWNASQRIFDPANSGARVASVIGGTVASNITSSDHPWLNACAVRISYPELLRRSCSVAPYGNRHWS
jgi:hypothetical protein